MPVPNLFIVGAPKCGTTALYTYLADHPDVFMSRIKEPQFFASDILGHQRTVASFAKYLESFASAQRHRRIGEASTTYLASISAGREIKALSPAAKIIILLRNPVDVMYAEHSERVFCNIEHLTDFAEAFDSHQVRTWRAGPFKGQAVIRPTYREIVRFSEQVRRYFDIFGEKNVQVILRDDLRTDPAQTYRDTLEFLGLRDVETVTNVIHANHRARSMLLQDLLRYPPQRLRKVGKRLIPKPIRSGLARLIYRWNVVYEPRPPMDRELKRRLQRELEPDIEQLARLLRRDLSAWCSGDSAEAAGSVRLCH